LQDQHSLMLTRLHAEIERLHNVNRGNCKGNA
jgi:hypothetical protein